MKAIRQNRTVTLSNVAIMVDECDDLKKLASAFYFWIKKSHVIGMSLDLLSPQRLTVFTGALQQTWLFPIAFALHHSLVCQTQAVRETVYSVSERRKCILGSSLTSSNYKFLYSFMVRRFHLYDNYVIIEV